MNSAAGHRRVRRRGPCGLQGQFLFPPADAGIDILRLRASTPTASSRRMRRRLPGRRRPGNPDRRHPRHLPDEVRRRLPAVRPPFEAGRRRGRARSARARAAAARRRASTATSTKIIIPWPAGVHPELRRRRRHRLHQARSPSTFHADSRGYFHVDGNFDHLAGPLRVQAGVGAAVAPAARWQLTAFANLTLEDVPVVGDIGPIGGQFALSSVGLAACVMVTSSVLSRTSRAASASASPAGSRRSTSSR